MRGFYRKKDHWPRYHEHNHLRITRIIASLTLLRGGSGKGSQEMRSEAGVGDRETFYSCTSSVRKLTAFRTPEIGEFAVWKSAEMLGNLLSG
jgi:hypothetical protein